jgi:formylglycine-generating enzyme required for sulfatase activity
LPPPGAPPLPPGAPFPPPGGALPPIEPAGASEPGTNAQVALATLPPDHMASIPAGSFVMGCDPHTHTGCQPDEQPAHRVTLDSNDIDITEVTVADYGACVAAGACQAPTTPVHLTECNWGRADRMDHPINCVNFYQAEEYCGWLGKRLPTEAEWEMAALGQSGATYPWGNDPPSCDRGAITMDDESCAATTTAPVGSHPSGASPFGLMDMAGNVQEWLSDWYDRAFYNQSPERNPVGPPGGTERATRGGDFDDDEQELRATARDGHEPWKVDTDIGFRCARSERP